MRGGGARRLHRSTVRSALIAILCLLTLTPAAGAASIAYIDRGEVWLSSLDGARKIRLAPPVVNHEGKTENWLAVAASDSGRIVAARNVPGRMSNFSWFKVWEPDGTSTVEGALNAPSGWTVYTYPLGFDLTADGKHMVYGYSNTGACCPITFGQGTYVRLGTSPTIQPIVLSGQEDPTLFGSRVIAHAGATVNVQTAAATTYGTDFAPWLDVSGTGLELRRTDLAANGKLAALELEQWNGGTQETGKIAVLSTQGVDQAPTFAVDCFLPASGVAKNVSLSADATRVAWIDGQGLKVAGAPTSGADPCVLTSPPVVISATASEVAIGGADVGPFMPAAPPPPPPTGGTPPTAGAPPIASLPGRIKAAALAKGVPIKVRVAGAGKVKLSGKVGRRVVATGSATAKRAGTVTVKLRLTAAARKKPRRLKGKRMTLRVSHGGLTSTKSLKLR